MQSKVDGYTRAVAPRMRGAGIEIGKAGDYAWIHDVAPGTWNKD